MNVRRLLFNTFAKKMDLVLKRPGTQQLLEKKYITINKALRTDDYDDAWTFGLGLNSEIIFDIGSNIGQASLLMLYSEDVKEIFLVDPNPSALSAAAENLILNNLSHKARFIPAFASDKSDGLIKFFTVGSGAAGSMYDKHAKTAARMSSHSEVPTTTIDTLAAMYNLTPDLVKIDVEGAEYLVLKGSAQTAKKGLTKFMVEMHSNPDLPMLENAENVMKWCSEMNYTCWYLKEGAELKSSATIAGRGRCHLLLLPKGEPYPSYLKNIQQGASIEEVPRGK